MVEIIEMAMFALDMDRSSGVVEKWGRKYSIAQKNCYVSGGPDSDWDDLCRHGLARLFMASGGHYSYCLTRAGISWLEEATGIRIFRSQEQCDNEFRYPMSNSNVDKIREIWSYVDQAGIRWETAEMDVVLILTPTQVGDFLRRFGDDDEPVPMHGWRCEVRVNFSDLLPFRAGRTQILQFRESPSLQDGGELND